MEVEYKNKVDNLVLDAQPTMDPPSYFEAVTQQPYNFQHCRGPPHSQVAIIPRPQNATSGLLDCLTDKSELYIRQSSTSCCNAPEKLQIVDRTGQPIISAAIMAINSTSYQFGERSSSYDHLHGNTSYVMKDMSGRIVLRFEDNECSLQGAKVTSGGSSLGTIHGETCGSADISATTTVGMENFSLSAKDSKILFWPFGIDSFDICCHGITIGKFERIKNGLVKIGFPLELAMSSKAILLSMCLKGYLDIFAEMSGCSSGSRGSQRIILYLFIAIFFSAAICMIVYATIKIREDNAKLDAAYEAYKKKNSYNYNSYWDN